LNRGGHPESRTSGAGPADRRKRAIPAARSFPAALDPESSCIILELNIAAEHRLGDREPRPVVPPFFSPP